MTRTRARMCRMSVQIAPRIVLAESQQEAVRLALSSKVLVITGGPGVGKTTLIDAILRILRAKHVDAALCAPTGRAAKRLSESTGLEAKTIHRLLETDPKTGGFRRTEQHALTCDLLVVDEASMVDVLLMRALLRWRRNVSGHQIEQHERQYHHQSGQRQDD